MPLMRGGTAHRSSRETGAGREARSCTTRRILRGQNASQASSPSYWGTGEWRAWDGRWVRLVATLYTLHRLRHLLRNQTFLGPTTTDVEDRFGASRFRSGFLHRQADLDCNPGRLEYTLPVLYSAVSWFEPAANFGGITGLYKVCAL